MVCLEIDLHAKICRLPFRNNWLDFQESVVVQHTLQILSLQAGSLGWVFESLLAQVMYLTTVRASDYLPEY